MATNRELKAVQIKNATATITLPTTTSTLATLAGTETLTNKSTTALVQTSFEEFPEIATPATPAANKHRTYFKSDGKFYRINSSGTEVEVGSPTVVVAIYESNATQAFANNTSSPYENYRWDAQIVDTHSAVTTGASWKFTAPLDGYYALMPTIGMNSSPTGTTQLYLFINGTYVVTLGDRYFLTAPFAQTWSTVVQLTTGDEVEFPIYQDTGASHNSSYGAIGALRISINSVGLL